MVAKGLALAVTAALLIYAPAPVYPCPAPCTCRKHIPICIILWKCTGLDVDPTWLKMLKKTGALKIILITTYDTFH